MDLEIAGIYRTSDSAMGCAGSVYTKGEERTYCTQQSYL